MREAGRVEGGRDGWLYVVVSMVCYSIALINTTSYNFTATV
jgi:hypothetical protein